MNTPSEVTPSYILPRERTRLNFLLFLFVILAISGTSARAAEDYLNNPAHRYHNRYYTEINTIVMRALPPELVKRFDLLKPGSLLMTFRVNRAGKISNLKVTAGGQNQFAQQTAARVIRGLKFPPMPKGAMEEDGHPWMDIRLDLSIPAVQYH